MAYTLIGSVSAGSIGAAPVTTAPVDTTGATLIVIVCGLDSSATPTLSDSKLNSYTDLTGTNTDFARCQMAYVQAPTVGAAHTFTSGSAAVTICVFYFSGSVSTPFDQQNGAAVSGSTSRTTGSITPTENNEVVIAGAATENGDTLTINGGFSTPIGNGFSGGNHYGAFAAYLIQTSATAANPTWSWTNSSNVAARIASFKDTPTAAGFGGLLGAQRNRLVQG